MIPASRAPVCFLSALLVASCAGSQPPPSTSAPLVELEAGQRVRVLAPPAERREGDVSAVNPSASVLRVHFESDAEEIPGAEQEVNFSSI